MPFSTHEYQLPRSGNKSTVNNIVVDNLRSYTAAIVRILEFSVFLKDTTARYAQIKNRTSISTTTDLRSNSPSNAAPKKYHYKYLKNKDESAYFKIDLVTAFKF